ncbi:MAG: hypothetical protein JXA67_03030 [Micromonosporaceae bacterium]|nr:hypothetical protein [Micromonosporaceae bacterium]
MALSELVALETAYRALQPLESPARRRSLRWLTDALEVPTPLPEREAGSQEVLPSGGATQDQIVEGAAVPPSGAESVSEPVAADGSPAGSASAGSASAGSTAGQSRTGRAGTSARGARKSRAVKSPGTPSGEEGGEKERVYRRMPPAEDVLRAYAEVGTISGLAEYFGVPRHTVQGWARRLRSSGYVIGRGA